MRKIYYMIVLVVFCNTTTFGQTETGENIPGAEDTMQLVMPADTINNVSIFTGRYVPKSDSLVESKTIKLISKAYLLAGPNWDDVIITHLKEGSAVLIESSKNGWSYVRVYSEPGNEAIKDKRVTGFVNNKSLGLSKSGKPLKK